MKIFHLLLISTLLLLQGCTRVEATSSSKKTVVTCNDITNPIIMNSYSSLDSEINWKSSPDYIIITSKTQTVYIPRYKCDLIIFR